jgi:hypothetical protein
VDLTGSTFILLNLPANPGEAPIPNTLFVDTTDGQKALAIESAVRNLFGFSPATVSRAPIEYQESGKTLQVIIPGLLSYNISFRREQPLSPVVSDGLYLWLSNPKQEIVQSVIYSPKAQNRVEYFKTNAISAEFRIPVRE